MTEKGTDDKSSLRKERIIFLPRAAYFWLYLEKIKSGIGFCADMPTWPGRGKFYIDLT